MVLLNVHMTHFNKLFHWTRLLNGGCLRKKQTVNSLRKSPTSVRIALFGFYGYGNLGDAAIQETAIQGFKRIVPNPSIWGVSLNPADTRKRHNIPSFPIYRTNYDENFFQENMENKKKTFEAIKERIKGIRLLYEIAKFLRRRFRPITSFENELLFLLKIYNFLKNFDFLIISGGGAVDEYWGGPWRHPYAFFKWAVMCKIAGSKLIVVSVGVGSIRSKLSRFFYKRGLAIASYRSFRDNGSRRLVERMGIRGEQYIYPDLAFGFQVSNKIKFTQPLSDKRIIGIGPLPYFDPRVWPEKGLIRYNNYLDKLASFVLWLIRNEFTALFLCGETSHDPPVISDLRQKIIGLDKNISEERLIDQVILTVEDLLSQIALTEMVITSRFHGVVLAQILYKPVIAISYDRKVYALMEEMGQSKLCLDVDGFDQESLIEKFIWLQENCETTKAEIINYVCTKRTMVESQFDRLKNILCSR